MLDGYIPSYDSVLGHRFYTFNISSVCQVMVQEFEWV